MQGQYQPYPPMPPGPFGPPPPPRRGSGANLVPLFIVIGMLAVAMLGAVAFVIVKANGGGHSDYGTVRTVVPSYNPRAVTAPFSGTWTGSGYYYNASHVQRTFNATISLTQGAETGTSSYTGFACSGLLRVESVTPTKVVMAETITQGNQPGGNCADAASGYVTLTARPDGGALYTWYSTRQKMLDNNTSSQATLTRQSSTAGTT